MNVASKRTFPFYLHISTLVILLVLTVGASVTYISYSRTTQILEIASRDLFKHTAREAESEFEQLFAPGEMATNLLALQSVTRATNLDQRLDSLAFLKTALDSSPEISYFFTGYGNGDAFIMRRLTGNSDRKLMAAPSNAYYMVQSIERQNSVIRGDHIYYDKDLIKIGSEELQEHQKIFDARTLDWYKKAIAVDHLILTTPYVFPSDGTIGTAMARRSDVKGVVAGAAIRLNSLAVVLSQKKFSPRMQLALVGGTGLMLANESMNSVTKILPDGSLQRVHIADFSSLPLNSLAKKIMPDGQIPINRNGRLIEADFLVEGERWFGNWVKLNIQGDHPVYLAMVIPERDIIGKAHSIRHESLISIFLVLLFAIPLAVLLARALSKPLLLLAVEAQAVQKFDFSNFSAGRSIIAEVDNLSMAVDSMRQTIRQFLHINQTVAAEEDFDVLMLKLLTETASAIDANGGVLFLTNAKADRFRMVASITSNAEHLFKTSDEIDINDLPMLLAKSIDTLSTHSGKLSASEFLALKIPNDDNQADEQWAIAMPLLNRKKHIVGALLFLAAGQANATKLSFLTALAASSAISLETRELIRAQKELFESFIRMIAGAIDAKSPYTGGHCARVPDLTKMLARAACDANEGPYADFTLQLDDWEAVHIAAWLHDCGKVTTPEFVVDKATKLETIYDRIHEIRLRFELLKKDAETDYWKSIAQGGDDIALRQKLDSERATLDDEFAFVAQCNQGGEFFSAENQMRLQKIGARTWLRTLDNRLGIAHEALKQLENTPPSTLPCFEPLLSDRPEHRITRPENQRFDSNNPWGFRMQVPELLYNRGELHNLSISRGTLTDEERYKINEHIIQTLIMLSQLPFPKHLQAVPEIAGGHHEKMDGTGYPKKLTREQMSPIARMMAIADIFEALTAIDRPYKKGKSLSEAVKIMAFMKRDQHIDAELFELFLRSGVYMEYAKRYMTEALIDEVNIDEMLNL